MLMGQPGVAQTFCETKIAVWDISVHHKCLKLFGIKPRKTVKSRWPYFTRVFHEFVCLCFSFCFLCLLLGSHALEKLSHITVSQIGEYNRDTRSLKLNGLIETSIFFLLNFSLDYRPYSNILMTSKVQRIFSLVRFSNNYRYLRNDGRSVLGVSSLEVKNFSWNDDENNVDLTWFPDTFPARQKCKLAQTRAKTNSWSRKRWNWFCKKWNSLKHQ